MERLLKINKLLQEKGLDCLLIESKVTKAYLRTLDGSGCKVFFTKNESFLILDGRYLEQAKKVEENLTIILWNPQEEGSSYLTWIEKYMKQKKLKNIGVETTITVSDYQFLTSFSKPQILSTELNEIRMIKTSEEISQLQKAIDVADSIYLEVLNKLYIGMTDYEISGLLSYYSLKAGASGMSFDTIIGLGTSSAYPHIRPSGKKIKRNEIIMIDFGLSLNGFQSDMTRVSCFGNPSKHIKEIHEIVLAANEAGISMIKEGVEAKRVDYVAREVINQAGYGQYFNHGLGHGIGMDNSTELPKLKAQSEIILQNNMVMSCEPGIYVPGVGGIRIEDDIWINKGQGVALNKIDKEIKIL